MGKNPSVVAKDQSLYAAVLSSNEVEKTVRLAFAREIDSAKVCDALSERLRPALGAESVTLKEFERHFDGLTFKKAGEIRYFTGRDGGRRGMGEIRYETAMAVRCGSATAGGRREGRCGEIREYKER